MTNFKVKKGKNFFFGPRWNFIGKNKGGFTTMVSFWDNCKYKLTENYDQINKLTGQSFNLLPWYDKESLSWKLGHHKNSARFGWRCLDGVNIEIFAYAYINGIRNSRNIISVDTSEWIHLCFKETDSYYNFSVLRENGETSIARFKKYGTRKGFLKLFIYRLYPYFGGSISAPHNMNMTLKYLKKFI